MTEAQLRHLSSVMRRLDEALLEIESGLGSPTHKEVLIIHQNDVPSSRRPAILTEIERLRQEVREVKEQYKLSIEAISDQRGFTVKLALIAIELEATNSHHTARYGTLSQDERDQLDRQISRMVEMVESLRMMIAAPDC